MGLEFIFLAYDLAVVIIPTLIVYGIRRKRNKSSQRRESIVGVLFLALYITAVLNVTGFGTIYDYLRAGFDEYYLAVNLIPFANGRLSTTHILNIIMLMPLGFLIPLLWKGADKLRYMFCYGFGFSLLIELSQLLNARLTDIDDLIMNTLGAVIGYGIYKLFRVVKKDPREKAVKKEFFAPILYIGVMCLGWFLLNNSLGLAMYLYW